MLQEDSKDLALGLGDGLGDAAEGGQQGFKVKVRVCCRRAATQAMMLTLLCACMYGTHTHGSVHAPALQLLSCNHIKAHGRYSTVLCMCMHSCDATSSVVPHL
jgi:hypothetical protein